MITPSFLKTVPTRSKTDAKRNGYTFYLSIDNPEDQVDFDRFRRNDFPIKAFTIFIIILTAFWGIKSGFAFKYSRDVQYHFIGNVVFLLGNVIPGWILLLTHFQSNVCLFLPQWITSILNRYISVFESLFVVCGTVGSGLFLLSMSLNPNCSDFKFYGVSECNIEAPCKGLPPDQSIVVFLGPIIFQSFAKSPHFIPVFAAWIASMGFIIASVVLANAESAGMVPIYSALFGLLIYEIERRERDLFMTVKRLSRTQAQASQEKEDSGRVTAAMRQTRFLSILIQELSHDLMSPIHALILALEVAHKSVANLRAFDAISPASTASAASVTSTVAETNPAVPSVGGNVFSERVVTAGRLPSLSDLVDLPIEMLDSMKSTLVLMSAIVHSCVDARAVSDGASILVPLIESFNCNASLQQCVRHIAQIQSAVRIKLTTPKHGPAANWGRRHSSSIHGLAGSASSGFLVCTDRRWFEENVLWLLTNAVKLADENAEDPVEVKMFFSSVKVKDTQKGRKKRVLVTLTVEVTDTGAKLSDEARMALFSNTDFNGRLHVGDAAPGLFGILKRVESLGGELGCRARSDGFADDDRGSVFWLRIPVNTPHPDTTTSSPFSTSSLFSIGSDGSVDIHNGRNGARGLSVDTISPSVGSMPISSTGNGIDSGIQFDCEDGISGGVEGADSATTAAFLQTFDDRDLAALRGRVRSPNRKSSSQLVKAGGIVKCPDDAITLQPIHRQGSFCLSSFLMDGSWSPSSPDHPGFPWLGELGLEPSVGIRTGGIDGNYGTGAAAAAPNFAVDFIEVNKKQNSSITSTTKPENSVISSPGRLLTSFQDKITRRIEKWGGKGSEATAQSVDDFLSITTAGPQMDLSEAPTRPAGVFVPAVERPALSIHWDSGSLHSSASSGMSFFGRAAAAAASSNDLSAVGGTLPVELSYRSGVNRAATSIERGGREGSDDDNEVDLQLNVSLNSNRISGVTSFSAPSTASTPHSNVSTCGPVPATDPATAAPTTPVTPAVLVTHPSESMAVMSASRPDLDLFEPNERVFGGGGGGGGVGVGNASDAAAGLRIDGGLDKQQQQQQQGPIPLKNKQLYTQKKLEMLIVDNSIAIMKILSVCLKNEGHTVFQARTGSHALDMMMHRHFDVVLMEIALPGMNGPDCVKLLRQFELDNNRRPTVSNGNGVDPSLQIPPTESPPHHPQRHQLIVGMSANVDALTRAVALSSGMDGFLSKPFSVEYLVQSVAERLFFSSSSTTPASTSPAATNLGADYFGDTKRGPRSPNSRSSGTQQHGGTKPVPVTRASVSVRSQSESGPNSAFILTDDEDEEDGDRTTKSERVSNAWAGESDAPDRGVVGGMNVVGFRNQLQSIQESALSSFSSGFSVDIAESPNSSIRDDNSSSFFINRTRDGVELRESGKERGSGSGSGKQSDEEVEENNERLRNNTLIGVRDQDDSNYRNIREDSSSSDDDGGEYDLMPSTRTRGRSDSGSFRLRQQQQQQRRRMRDSQQAATEVRVSNRAGQGWRSEGEPRREQAGEEERDDCVVSHDEDDMC